MTDENAIGLPPRDDAPAPTPTPETLRFARMINAVGLFTPAANLGLFWVGSRARRWFGFSAGVVCAAAIGYARWRGKEWLGWTAAGVHETLVVVGLIDPRWVGKIGDAWAAFGTALGKVMVYPIFGAVYFLIVTPTALLFRLFGKDPLGRKNVGAATYWTPHEPPTKENYERQF